MLKRYLHKCVEVYGLPITTNCSLLDRPHPSQSPSESHISPLASVQKFSSLLIIINLRPSPTRPRGKSKCDPEIIPSPIDKRSLIGNQNFGFGHSPPSLRLSRKRHAPIQLKPSENPASGSLELCRHVRPRRRRVEARKVLHHDRSATSIR